MYKRKCLANILHRCSFKNKTENYPDSLYQDALFRKLESVARKKLVYFIHIWTWYNTIIFRGRFSLDHWGMKLSSWTGQFKVAYSISRNFSWNWFHEIFLANIIIFFIQTALYQRVVLEWKKIKSSQLFDALNEYNKTRLHLLLLFVHTKHPADLLGSFFKTAGCGWLKRRIHSALKMTK